MNGDLCSDIIGTNPNYPKIVDHSWLDVDLGKYDNYPSDNNPLRVIPKLHDLWNHAAGQNGVNLIPNSQVMPQGVRSNEEDARQADQVVKEAKKAIMAGLKGKQLTEHLRSRFASKHIQAAQEALKVVAEEIGLLGNVYIDASAFNTYHEAEQFMNQHRTRLARDILIHKDGINQNLLATLASALHKNVVASVSYDEDLLSKYRGYLVQANRIPSDMVIASKEDLRQAFLFVWPQKEASRTASKSPEKRLDKAQAKEALDKSMSIQAVQMSEERDSLLIHKISPIVSFVQENIAKGKTAGAIKEMVRGKFAMVDVKDAAEALGIVMSKEGLSEESLNSMIREGKISLVLGEELKKIGKKFPVKKDKIVVEETPEVEHYAGTPGYFNNLPSKKQSSEHDNFRNASVEALKRGFDIESVKAQLLKKLSADQADTVLLEAVTMLNSIPAGVVANKPIKPAKVAVEECVEKQTLPDPSTIEAQTQEILSTFEGCTMDIAVDPAQDFNAVEVNELFNRQGLDETIK